MGYWYHDIEDSQIGEVYEYINNNPPADFLIEFDDEFYQIVFELPDRTGPGRRRYNEYLSIGYRDFPVRITDIDRNVVVYPKTKE